MVLFHQEWRDRYAGFPGVNVLNHILGNLASARSSAKTSCSTYGRGLARLPPLIAAEIGRFSTGFLQLVEFLLSTHMARYLNEHLCALEMT